MQPADRATFAIAMTRLFAIYGDELTDALLDAWWGVLGPYELRDVRWAMNAHATDPDKGRFRPTPADIIRHITETLPAVKAERRRQAMIAARDMCRPLEDELGLLRTKIELGLLEGEALDRARARINGICMEVAAITREAGIDDSPRLVGAGTGALGLAGNVLPRMLEARRAYPKDPA